MKIKSLLCITLLLLSLSGCASNNDNKIQQIEVLTEVAMNTDNILTDDTSMFASGIVSDDNTDEDNAKEVKTITIDGEIDEFCPLLVTTSRKNVDYGEFTHSTYYSTTCGMDRGYSILLPADYDESESYPVLYLLHGIFGDEYSFSSDSNNKIKEILGNMEAEGCIRKTILVCPNMYATSDPDMKPAFDAKSVLPYDNFINDLVTDLMPHIENTYAVATGRENTYLAGFSMGGRETIYITLMHPELFSYVCAISAAPGIVPTQDSFMTHEGQMPEEDMRFKPDAIEPDKFIICCGTKDSVVGKYPESYHELLSKNGTNHIWYEITGADHDNKAIQSGIFNLLEQIAYGEQ